MLKKLFIEIIKPDNILFAQYFIAKISDFGISGYYKNFSSQNSDNNNYKDSDLLIKGTQVGCINFVSPEMEKSGKYDCSTDIYSTGLIILILMSKQYPIDLQNGQKKDK